MSLTHRDDEVIADLALEVFLTVFITFFLWFGLHQYGVMIPYWGTASLLYGVLWIGTALRKFLKGKRPI